MKGSKRLDRLVLALPLAPASTALFRLSTCCRKAWKCQVVMLWLSHLPGVLSWDSVSQVFGMGIAKVCLGSPWGWCGPGDSRRRGQWLRLAELNRACDGINVAMGLVYCPNPATSLGGTEVSNLHFLLVT